MATGIMPWFKWWDGTSEDIKFRMVADDCKMPVCAIVGVWAYLLERASKADLRGNTAGVDFEEMGYTLMLPDPETVCNAMKRRKLIDENGFVTKWENRQGKRERSEEPGASTARVQKHRAAKKAQQDNDLGDDDDGNAGNAGNGNETAGNATERPKRKKKIREEIKPKPTSPAGAGGDVVKTKPFDLFWSSYPRKEGKIKAQQAWVKHKLDAQADVVLAAIEAQKGGDAWMREDGRFIPHPTTWLNGGRWLDEVRPYAPPPPKLPPGWWTSHDGIKAAGAMCSPPIIPRSGEYPNDVAQRIRVALGLVDGAQQTAQSAPPVVQQYLPPAPPEGVQLTEDQINARREEMRQAMRTMNTTAANQRAGVAPPKAA